MSEEARLRRRVRGCLLGGAIGDALGAPFEGHPRVEAAAVRRWADSERALRWTDDTHMTIGLARSLLARDGFDGAHAAAEFARNYRAEPWRGYGAGPPQVFAALDAGAEWDEPARRLFGGQGSFGNGAAMRVAPVALVAHANPDLVVGLARSSARITHAHELGQQAAALQAAAISWLVAAEPAPGWDGSAELLAHLRRAAPDPAFQRQLGHVERGLERSWDAGRVVQVIGNGIAGVEAVPAALYAFLHQPLSLPGAVIHAICLGGDTDTIASMTGSLAGAFLGEQAVPSAWRDRLEAADELTGLADQLVGLSKRVR